MLFMKDNKTKNDTASVKYYKTKQKTKKNVIKTPESKTFVIKYAHKLLISCQNI